MKKLKIIFRRMEANHIFAGYHFRYPERLGVGNKQAALLGAACWHYFR